MIKATKNRAPASYVFPDADDITKLQKTADWLLEQKIIPQRVDVATAVCPLETTAAR
jgi:sulfonate transport system substrate-binding protein